jgi:adenosylhomocysteine nucleosidase
MEKEIAYIREHLGAELKDGVYIACFEGHKVIASVSGIGKVNSAITTQRIIDKFSPDYVINIGIAGGLDRSLAVLDMVVAKDTVYHDFYPLSLLEEDSSIGKSVFDCDKYLVALAESACQKLLNEGKIKKFVTGRIVSGDSFVEDDQKSRALREEMGGSCVEMEGAAISQTCIVNKIPFVVVRSISDFADNNAGMSYDDFADFASTQAGLALIEIIKGL